MIRNCGITAKIWFFSGLVILNPMPRFTFLLLLILPSYSWACTCEEVSASQHFVNAQSVFTGKVVSRKVILFNDTTRINNTKYYLILDSVYKVTFRVRHQYKGLEYTDTLSVITPAGIGECGYKFIVGKSYLVYSTVSHASTHDYQGNPAKPLMITSLCAGNRPLRFYTLHKKPAR